MYEGKMMDDNHEASARSAKKTMRRKKDAGWPGGDLKQSPLTGEDAISQKQLEATRHRGEA